MKAKTTDYDPRYDRAQTVKGAKARYVDDNMPEYGIKMLEADLERLLTQGEMPDPYQGGYKRPPGISLVANKKQCPTCGEWGVSAPCEDCRTPESLLGSARVK